MRNEEDREKQELKDYDPNAEYRMLRWLDRALVSHILRDAPPLINPPALTENGGALKD